MKPEKPWIFPKIALGFTIIYIFILQYIIPPYLSLLSYIYGKEFLNSDRKIFAQYNLALLPIIVSILIIILSLLLKKSKKDKETAFITFTISIFVALFTLIAFSRGIPRPKACQASCLSNLKQIGIAISLYQEDYDSQLPPLGSDWNSTLESYTKTSVIFHCPIVESSKYATYAFNNKIAGINVKNTSNPKELIAIFESNPGKNLFGSSELLQKYPRHSGGDNYGFLDGHAKWIKRYGPDISKFQPVLAE